MKALLLLCPSPIVKSLAYPAIRRLKENMRSRQTKIPYSSVGNQQAGRNFRELLVGSKYCSQKTSYHFFFFLLVIIARTLVGIVHVKHTYCWHSSGFYLAPMLQRYLLTQFWVAKPTSPSQLWCIYHLCRHQQLFAAGCSAQQLDWGKINGSKQVGSVQSKNFSVW